MFFGFNQSNGKNRTRTNHNEQGRNQHIQTQQQLQHTQSTRINENKTQSIPKNIKHTRT